MRSSNSTIRLVENDKLLQPLGHTGISMHCHSMHSKEILDFVPYYAERIPILSSVWKRKMRRFEEREGRLPNFNIGYWTPPLTGQQVFESEAASIESLGLMPIVSVTDHDSINANTEINQHVPNRFAPISMEWTVPFAHAFFHIGVHNMPEDRADEISKHLLDYTFDPNGPDDERLSELFAMMHDIPEMLVVLNHPIWDIEMIGQQKHEAALHEFLRTHGCWIHAIEINGFRSMTENNAATELAEACGLPVVSGGDRHCCQANTMINVTKAASFSEFVSEVRVDKHSEVLVLPDYHKPLPSRQLRSMSQILGVFPDFPDGRRSWSDRIFFDAEDGLGPRPLTEHWNGQLPGWTRVAMWALKALSHDMLVPVLGFTVGDTDIGRSDEKTPPISFEDIVFADPSAFAKPKAMAAGR